MKIDKKSDKNSDQFWFFDIIVVGAYFILRTLLDRFPAQNSAGNGLGNPALICWKLMAKMEGIEEYRLSFTLWYIS